MRPSDPPSQPEPPLLHIAERSLYVVPIRHHSPACSAHLQRLLEEVKPAAVLVEGPCDFDPHIALLNDVQTTPPVAIVALREASGENGIQKATSYFPFCSHSPEFLALRYGVSAGVVTRFIDLPSHSRALMGEDVEAPPPNMLSDEGAFDSGDFVTALAREMGCRDGNEVWDQLFETQISHQDWRGFFEEVGHYCACVRAATSDAIMQSDGTLAREAQMRALVAETRGDVEGPIVVLVGGFHAPALMQATVKSDRITKPNAKAGAGYLVRYGNRQLDALQGYSAGLPLPGFYEKWWQWHQEHEAGTDPRLWAHSLIGGFSEHLREAGKAPPFPVMLAAVEQSERLASLRGRTLPFRDDILDAVRSTFIKDESPRHGGALLNELLAWLTGTAMGDVPASAGSPPLVEWVRKEARRLRFAIDDGEIRQRNLDIYRKDTHREASRFCHGLALLGAGFATRTAGPDFRNDVGLDRLFEIWSVSWSPMVEARLIEVAHKGDTLSEAIAVTMAERLAELEAEGKGRNALEAIELFAIACRAGIGQGASAILELVEAEVIEDADIASVIAALDDVVLLRRGHQTLGIENVEPLDRLLATTWRRVVILAPDLAAIPPDQAGGTVQALANLRGTIDIAQSAGFPFNLTAFEEVLIRLEAAELAPQIDGAVMAFALLDGRKTGADLKRRLTGELAGAYVEDSEKLAFLGGVIVVARELLWAIPEVVEALDETIGRADEEEFIALLPHLRLALMPLDPRDIDRLSTVVATKLGVSSDAMQNVVQIDEGELIANLEADRAMADKLRLEGVV